MDLGDLHARCFQGVIPAIIATCASDGTPNVTYVSQVYRVAPQLAALSCQFFNKTKQNVLQNPYACVQLYDPLSFEAYRLELRYLRSEESGPLFDGMAVRIQGIASHTGMAGVFKLISADVYELLACEKLHDYLLPWESEALEPEAMTGAPSELRALQLLSQRICKAHGSPDLLDTILDTLDDALGFSHGMVLLPDESGARLLVHSARGYGESGAGAEVALGEGLIGTAARERRLLRISDIAEELRYGRAIRAGIERTSARRELRAEIPLPGLPDAQSQMIMPLVIGERLVGVLAIESRERFAFDAWDEAFLEIIANHVAMALAREADLPTESTASASESATAAAAASTAAPPRAPAPAASVSAPTRVRRFKFYRSDDCVFIDDDYLIRNVPGRILWKLLRAHHDEGRSEFSNRELRLDAALGLPALRDNLESRLTLLRKRLQQKCPDVRLLPTTRGHFKLELDSALQLEEVDGAP